MLAMLWEPSPLGENSCQLISFFFFFLEDTGTKTMLAKHTEGHVIGGIANPAPACSDSEELPSPHSSPPHLSGRG